MFISFFLIVIAFFDKILALNRSDYQFDQYEGVEASEGLMGLMTSNDLILVVLGVSLIIWFTLLAFLYKIDRKVTQLEQKYESEPHLNQ